MGFNDPIPTGDPIQNSPYFRDDYEDPIIVWEQPDYDPYIDSEPVDPFGIGEDEVPWYNDPAYTSPSIVDVPPVVTDPPVTSQPTTGQPTVNRPVDTTGIDFNIDWESIIKALISSGASAYQINQAQKAANAQRRAQQRLYDKSLDLATFGGAFPGFIKDEVTGPIMTQIKAQLRGQTPYVKADEIYDLEQQRKFIISDIKSGNLSEEDLLKARDKYQEIGNEIDFYKQYGELPSPKALTQDLSEAELIAAYSRAKNMGLNINDEIGRRLQEEGLITSGATPFASLAAGYKEALKGMGGTQRWNPITGKMEIGQDVVNIPESSYTVTDTPRTTNLFGPNVVTESKELDPFADAFASAWAGVSDVPLTSIADAMYFGPTDNDTITDSVPTYTEQEMDSFKKSAEEIRELEHRIDFLNLGSEHREIKDLESLKSNLTKKYPNIKSGVNEQGYTTWDIGDSDYGNYITTLGAGNKIDTGHIFSKSATQQEKTYGGNAVPYVNPYNKPKTNLADINNNLKSSGTLPPPPLSNTSVTGEEYTTKGGTTYRLPPGLHIGENVNKNSMTVGQPAFTTPNITPNTFQDILAGRIGDVAGQEKTDVLKQALGEQYDVDAAKRRTRLLEDLNLTGALTATVGSNQLREFANQAARDKALQLADVDLRQFEREQALKNAALDRALRGNIDYMGATTAQSRADTERMLGLGELGYKTTYADEYFRNLGFDKLAGAGATQREIDEQRARETDPYTISRTGTADIAQIMSMIKGNPAAIQNILSSLMTSYGVTAADLDKLGAGAGGAMSEFINQLINALNIGG
jgi:hypothetical protein